jgi:hypothetical protein
MLGLGPPEEAPAQDAGGFRILVHADLPDGPMKPLGADNEKQADELVALLKSRPGFSNVRWERNPNYGRNPLIDNRPTNPAGNGGSPGPWIIDQRPPKQPTPAPTATPQPSATPVSLPPRSPVTAPANPVIDQKLDQLRDTIFPESKPNSQLSPGKTNRFGYDETLAKTAPKGVLMRVAIGQATLQSAQAAPQLLARIRK